MMMWLLFVTTVMSSISVMSVYEKLIEVPTYSIEIEMMKIYKDTVTYDGFMVAIHFVLEHEGERFVQDTSINEVSRRGITLGAFRKYYGYGTEHSIKNITVNQAKEIYKHSFWNKNNLDSLVDIGFRRTSIVLMDSEVNIGPYRANKFFQKALGMPRRYRSGYIDEITLGYLKHTLMTDEELLSEVIRLRRNHYSRLVKKREVFKKYHKGWNNRLDNILVYSKEMK